MEVNKVYKLECIGMNHLGEGVCRYNEYVIFVKFLILGEIADIRIVKINKLILYGKIEKLYTESSERCEVKCDYFNKGCGSCQLLHMSYKNSLNFKIDTVKNSLKKFARIEYSDINIISAINAYNYRNKIILHFGKINKRTILGYYKSESNDIIEVKSCMFNHKDIEVISSFVVKEVDKLDISIYNTNNVNGILRHIQIRSNLDNEFLITFIITQHDSKMNVLIKNITTRFSNIKGININYNHKSTNNNFGLLTKQIYGVDNIIEKLGINKYLINYNSFFQINTNQALKLYEVIKDFSMMEGNEIVVDAYSGVGSIGLFLAKYCKKVILIEVVKEAHLNAIKNASLNNITNCIFINGKVENEYLKLDEKVDVLIVDPPRKGLDSDFINFLLNNKVANIIYVSCDNATFSRDINLLKDTYKIDKINLIDMFPYTSHIEICAKLVLNK